MFTRQTKILTCLVFVLSIGSLFFQTEAAFGSWEFYTGEINGRYGVPGSPAISDDGTIYVGSLTGYFYALNPDGTLKWKYPPVQPGDPFGYTPAIGHDGTIYVGAYHTLYAFNPDGTMKYSHTADCLFLGAPAIESDGTLYIGSNSSKLYAFYSDLTPKWEYSLPDFEGAVSNPVIGSDGTIYFKAGAPSTSSNPPYRLYAIYPDRTWKWEWIMGPGVEAPPAIGRDGTIYFTDFVKLYAVDRNTGHRKWEFAADYNTTFTDQSSPVIGADRTIYVTGWDLNTQKGILFAINPDDGSRKWANSSWESTTETGYHGPPAVGADGSIFFGSEDTYIYRIVDHGTYGLLTAVGGTEGQVVSSPALGYDGVLYIGCAFSVKAYDTVFYGPASYGPANSSWPIFRGNLKRTAKVDPLVFAKGLLKFLRKLVVVSYHFGGGIENSLVSKLDSAYNSLENEREVAAANKLKAFINEVKALAGKKIPRREADNLIMEARRIISSLFGREISPIDRHDHWNWKFGFQRAIFQFKGGK